MLSDGNVEFVEVEILGDEFFLKVLYCVCVKFECRNKDKFVFYIEDFQMLIIVDLFVVVVIGVEEFFVDVRLFGVEEFLQNVGKLLEVRNFV